MSVKVIMTWDIAAERDREYFEFVIGEFVPGVQRLGLQPSEAWATIYGSYPQIQVGLLANDAAQARPLARILPHEGVQCETCHGPGEAHQRDAQRLAVQPHGEQCQHARDDR